MCSRLQVILALHETVASKAFHYTGKQGLSDLRSQPQVELKNVVIGCVYLFLLYKEGWFNPSENVTYNVTPAM